MNRSIRLALCFVVCAAISDSVLAVDLSPGRVQVDPSIPYPEKMTFVGLSQSMLLGASMGTSGLVKEYVRNAAGQRRNLTPVPVFVREEFSEAIRASGFTPEDDLRTARRNRPSLGAMIKRFRKFCRKNFAIIRRDKSNFSAPQHVVPRRSSWKITTRRNPASLSFHPSNPMLVIRQDSADGVPSSYRGCKVVCRMDL